MRKSNLATSLRRKVRSNSMQACDVLPPEARRWLASACLPWSPQSVGRLWRRALRDENGCKHHATARLDAAERRLLERDWTAVFFEVFVPKAPLKTRPAALPSRPVAVDDQKSLTELNIPSPSRNTRRDGSRVFLSTSLVDIPYYFNQVFLKHPSYPARSPDQQRNKEVPHFRTDCP